MGCSLTNKEIIKPVNAKECTIKNKSGEKITISKNVDLLKDSKGNIIGGIESFEDITLRKRAENYMKNAKEEAERSALMKFDIFGNDEATKYARLSMA